MRWCFGALRRCLPVGSLAEPAAQRQQQMMVHHRAQPRHEELIDLDAIGPTGRFASGEVVDLT